MKHKLSDRRRKAGILTLILAVAILVTGTLAWQAISQRAVNNVEGEILPAGARLHDDFGLEDEPDFTQPLNKDVFVENYSGQNPQNTNDSGEPVFVRVKLMEYMEMGVGAGLFGLSGSDPSDYQTLDQVDAGGTRVEDPANDATSLVPGASILDLSTWRTHIEDDLSNPFASYWTWTMGGIKAFMPTFNKDNTSLLTDRTNYAHDKYAVGDKENGIALYSNPTYNNNPEEHTAKNTLTTAGIVSMDEWMNDLNHPTAEAGTGNGYWVGDSDGWYYWSKALEPGEATALLLDQITLTGTIEGEFYYGIHVISEMATSGDWGDADDETGFYEDGLTEDGKYLLDQAAGLAAKGNKLLYAPMDDTGTILPKMLLYAPMDGLGSTSTVSPPNLTDSVTNTAFTIKAGSVTTSSNSQIGDGSAYFSGARGQRIAGQNSNLNFGTNDFTVSFWVNPDTMTNGYPMVFSTDHYSSENNLRFAITSNGNSRNVQLYHTLGNSLIAPNVSYTPGVWTHYAIIRKDGVFTLYQDGVAIGSNSTAVSLNIDLTTLSIGGDDDSTTAYKGYIDDFAIYNYAKYVGNFTPPTAAQADANLLYMDFDNTSYNQNPLHETISNSYFANVTNADIIGKDDQHKFGGSSLYFSGTSYQRISGNNSKLNLGTGDFTISFWVNPDTMTNGYPMVFSTDHYSSQNNLRFAITSNGNSRNVQLYHTLGNSLIAPNVSYTPGVWTHYAIIRKDGVFTLYQDGVAIGSNNTATSINVDLTTISIGGDDDSTTAYKGYIDDFVIYSYAKYTGNFTPPTVPADIDPTNVQEDPLDLKDVISGDDFTVRGNANLIGTGTQKKFGNASLYFPGTAGQRINIQNADLNFGAEDFTISFWTNPETQTKQWPTLFSSEDELAASGMRFLLDTSGRLQLWSWHDSVIITSSIYTPGVWTHYAVVRKNGIFTVYVDGINVGTNSGFATKAIDMSNFAIGGNSATTYAAYQGYMQDFSIYDYAVWDSDFAPPTAAGTP